MIPLNEVPGVIKFIETESRMAFARGGQEAGNGELFNGYRISVLQDEKSPGDWFHNNINVLNTTELHT